MNDKELQDPHIRRVEQTIFAPPDGNCLQACVASILDVGLDEVPNFAKLWNATLGEDGEWKSDSSTRWWDALGETAFQRGYTVLELAWPPIDKWGMGYPGAHEWLGIATVKSSRGKWDHCVVAKLVTGDVVWDPYPGAAAEGRNVADEGLSSWIIFVPNLRRIAEDKAAAVKQARIEGMEAAHAALRGTDYYIHALIAKERAR